MSDLIDRQAAISAICSACGKIDCDKMDKCEKLQLPPANCSEIPNRSDTISRRATINAVNNAFDRETLLTGFVRSIAVRAIRDMPSAQPEPSIPLSWIEKYIEWLKSLDNEFTKLAAAHISVMVKKWRDEKK